MSHGCHRLYVIVPYLAPLCLPISNVAFWVVAMGAFSPTEQMIFRVVLMLCALIFLVAIGCLGVCFWYGSRNQKLLALLAILAVIPTAILGTLLTYLVLPRQYWV